MMAIPTMVSRPSLDILSLHLGNVGPSIAPITVPVPTTPSAFRLFWSCRLVVRGFLASGSWIWDQEPEPTPNVI